MARRLSCPVPSFVTNFQLHGSDFLVPEQRCDCCMLLHMAAAADVHHHKVEDLLVIEDVGSGTLSQWNDSQKDDATVWA